MADLTEVVTVERGGELIVNTDHGEELEEIVEMHHHIDLTQVNTPLRSLRDQVVISQPGQPGEPTRPVQVGPQPVRPGGGGGGHLPVEEGEVEELVSHHIEEPRLVHQTVDNLLIRPLLLESSEDPVPDTEPAAVV